MIFLNCSFISDWCIPGITRLYIYCCNLLCSSIESFWFIWMRPFYGLLIQWILLCVFIMELNQFENTLSGGSLGSCDEEEQSQLCVVMWIAELFDHRPLERILRSQDLSWGHVCPSFGTFYHHVPKWWLESVFIKFIFCGCLFKVLFASSHNSFYVFVAIAFIFALS